jgi:hypothetical protein
MKSKDAVHNAAARIDRRGTARFEIRCPVTVRVRVPGERRKVRDLGRGTLNDIGERGARIHFSAPLAVKNRICLDIHFCSDPAGQMTTMRFWGIVERTSQEPPYEVAVRFVSRGLFLRDKLRKLNRTIAGQKRSENGEWIN